MKKLEKLQESLPKIGFDMKWDKLKKVYVDLDNLPVHSFIKDDFLIISGEHGDGVIDYYGEFRGGYPYIHPELEKWAEKNNGYWEWENAGAICFCVN